MQPQRKAPYPPQEMWRELRVPLPQSAPRRTRYLVPALVAGASLLLGGGAYFWMGWSFSSAGEIPLVAAPEGPYKVRPQGAQDTDTINTDKTIYDQLTGQGVASDEVRLREVPQDPVESAPALPDDFVKALAQSPLTSKDLEAAQDVSSPFAEGEAQTDPFAESDEGFFEEKAPVHQAGSFKATAHVAQEKQNAIHLLKRVNIPLEGENVHASQGKMLALEVASAATQDEAKAAWQETLRQVGPLIATQTPQYVRVDHGTGIGVKYHVRLASMIPEKAHDFKRRMERMGIQVQVLPQ